MPGMLRKSAAFAPRYRKFESISLLRGVTCEPELSVSAHHHSRHRVGIGDICLDRYDVSARRRNFRGATGMPARSRPTGIVIAQSPR